MGKRKKTAKTGDKALYSSRSLFESGHRHGDGDPRQEESGSFRDRDQDYLRLGEDGNVEQRECRGEDDDDYEILHQREVLDLGASVASDMSDEESSQESSVEMNENLFANPQDDLMAPSQGVEILEEGGDGDSSGSESDGTYSSSERKDYSASSESEDEVEDQQISSSRNWGRKKDRYYHGDTADLEIGQDEKDAFVEEEAALEVQSSRFEQMEEDDFVLSGEEENGSGKMQELAMSKSQEGSLTFRDTLSMSTKEKRKLMANQHPEIIPVISHFSDFIKEGIETNVATQVMTQAGNMVESFGATSQGRQYLLIKSLIQNSVALNTILYLLLKSDHDFGCTENNVSTQNFAQTHPVMSQLKRYNSTIQDFQEGIEKRTNSDIRRQIQNIVKAAALMSSSQQMSPEEDEEDKTGTSCNIHSLDINVKSDVGDPGLVPKESEQLTEKEHERIEEMETQVLHEARFGLRSHELKGSERKGGKRQVPNTFFECVDTEVKGSQRVSQSLASSINAIEQRFASESRRKSEVTSTEELFDVQDEDDQLAQGLKMMEEELGRDSLNGDEKVDLSGNDGVSEPALDTNEFYNLIEKRSKESKFRKSRLYRVAPKFPSSESNVHGERAISRTMLKNRGLVAHKAKINRNPRVKKREQYRKALISRKGSIREIRTDESHKYQGESTGIKSGISRSRKLLSK